MNTRIDQSGYIETTNPMMAADEDAGSLNVIQATAMMVMTIIAVTLGTIYGSIL